MGTLLYCNVQSEYVLLWSPLTQGYIDCNKLALVGIDNTTEASSENWKENTRFRGLFLGHLVMSNSSQTLQWCFIMFYLFPATQVDNEM